jgi:mannitol 2-dehydrogenase
LKEVLFNGDQHEDIIRRLTDEECKLVTLTVTEKGYTFDLKDVHSQVGESRNQPVTTVGLLVEALKQRKEKGLPPFIVMSLDNLPNNGDHLRTSVISYANHLDHELSRWIAENVDFPTTMVDRIVPKVSDESHAKFANTNYPFKDQYPIFTEGFRQLVIGTQSIRNFDSFPPLDEIENGALFAEDIAPYHLLKIRTLNGAHMLIGMLGRLNGYQYVHEAMQNPEIRNLVIKFMQEVAVILPEVPGVDISKYHQQLLDRFSNNAICDENSRLPRNAIGENKLKNRILASLEEAMIRHHNQPHLYETLMLAAASWMAYVQKAAHDPNFDLLDPSVAKRGLLDVARDMSVSNPSPLLAAYGANDIWNGLLNRPDFVSRITQAYQRVMAICEKQEVDQKPKGTGLGPCSPSPENL